MANQQKGPRLGDYFLEHRRTKTTFLDEINELINWQPINAFLRKKIRRKANAVGNPAYPPLAMFKILLLQRWYNLSDPGVEQALLDRLSFVRFTGFSIEDDVPDETTICRFRNGLIRLKALDALLDMLNRQLEDQGLLVREGAVVDASVVESQRRPRKSRQIMDTIKSLLLERGQATPPKSLLGRAISYALGQWERVETYLEDGILLPDNNLAENAIRPFEVGRKNWLFSGSPRGAAASAALYSLVETAKANGLEPLQYLHFLFERLPSMTSDDERRGLLPQYIDAEKLV